MKIEREQQKAKNPGPTGKGQDQQVPTHEGSMLSTPEQAGVTTSKTPHLNK